MRRLALLVVTLLPAALAAADDPPIETDVPAAGTTSGTEGELYTTWH